MNKYPSIGQYRNLVQNIEKAYGYSQDEDDNWFRDHTKKLPTLELKATVKVHGTNASVVIYPDLTQEPQSKNNVISIEKDNAGFAAWHYNKQDYFSKLRASLETQYPCVKDKPIVVYGEWAGGNIQKNVAVASLDKFFYIFGIKVIEDNNDEDQNSANWWINLETFRVPEKKSYRIFRELIVAHVEIDFNNPKESSNGLISIVNLVEHNCPVAKLISIEDGVTLANTIGEGIVLSHITEAGEFIRCKVKGEKHVSSGIRRESLTGISLSKVEEMQVISFLKKNNCVEFSYSFSNIPEFPISH